MKVSKDTIELTEKLRKYRTDTKFIEELKIKNDLLEKQNKEIQNTNKNLKLSILDNTKLLDKIKNLENDKKRLILESEKSKNNYKLIVTNPNETSDTIYGEIGTEISKTQSEILICSPWISYIPEELSNLKQKENIKLKIITRLIRDDLEKGITDLDKFRALKNGFGAETRYNNDLHAKIIIIDRSVAIISSANLTKRAFSVNYEAGICIRNKDDVDRIRKFFMGIWIESLPLTEEAIKTLLL